MRAAMLDELDQRLIHSLQLSPRAPWTALAPILGADAITLARRWRRLATEGIVYATPVDSRTDAQVFAFLEISCPPFGIAGVVDVLIRNPGVTTVDRTAGGRDLMATAIGESVDAITEWSSDTFGPLDEVTSVRTLLVTALVADARSWRLRALRPREAAAVELLNPAEPLTTPRVSLAERDALVSALGDDFRATLSELADRTGLPQRKLGRILAWLQATDQLAIRVDVARSLTPWPVNVWYFLYAPASELDTVTKRLSQVPEMRVVANTVGQYNIVFAAWVHTLKEIQQMESNLESSLPNVRIADRAVVLRTEKHVGHLMDKQGLATGTVIPFVPIHS